MSDHILLPVGSDLVLGNGVKSTSCYNKLSDVLGYIVSDMNMKLEEITYNEDSTGAIDLESISSGEFVTDNESSTVADIPPSRNNREYTDVGVSRNNIAAGQQQYQQPVHYQQQVVIPGQYPGSIPRSISGSVPAGVPLQSGVQQRHVHTYQPGNNSVDEVEHDYASSVNEASFAGTEDDPTRDAMWGMRGQGVPVSSNFFPSTSQNPYPYSQYGTSSPPLK